MAGLIAVPIRRASAVAMFTAAAGSGTMQGSGATAQQLGSRARLQVPSDERAVLATTHDEALIGCHRDARGTEPRTTEDARCTRVQLDAPELLGRQEAILARTTHRVLLELLRDLVGMSATCHTAYVGGALAAPCGGSVHGSDHLLGEPYATFLGGLFQLLVVLRLASKHCCVLCSFLIAAVSTVELFIECGLPAAFDAVARRLRRRGTRRFAILTGRCDLALASSPHCSGLRRRRAHVLVFVSCYSCVEFATHETCTHARQSIANAVLHVHFTRASTIA